MPLRVGSITLAFAFTVAAMAVAAAPAPTIPSEHQRGYKLAQTYCQMCHLFPAPDILDQAAWRQGVLPKMSAWLGLSKPVPPPNADLDMATAPSVYPSAPLLPLESWLAISNYYVALAPVQALPQPERPKIQLPLPQFKVTRAVSRWPIPATCLVKIDPVEHKIILGDALSRTLNVLDSTGKLEQSLSLPSAPVSLKLNADGWYVTTIGHLFPSDDPVGGLSFLRKGQDRFERSDVLQQLSRPTDAAFADLNGDGREDLVICMFGNDRGRFSWFENNGAGSYTEHVLYSKPGAVRAYVRDFNQDGRPDIIVLWAQAEEGVYLFLNQGHGQFTRTALIQQHPGWGYAGFELVDWNGDGFMDFLTANGDNGDTTPLPMRNYHGVRLYLNDGHNHFREAFFYPLNGAYKAMAADFDGDGDLDIAAISFFPDYEKSPEESFVYLENKGGMQFAAYTFEEHSLGRWLTMDVGDVDGDGDLDIVLGSFSRGPTTTKVPVALSKQWEASGPSLLILKNTLR
jgi:hypothetical protein